MRYFEDEIAVDRANDTYRITCQGHKRLQGALQLVFMAGLAVFVSLKAGDSGATRIIVSATALMAIYGLLLLTYRSVSLVSPNEVSNKLGTILWQRTITIPIDHVSTWNVIEKTARGIPYWSIILEREGKKIKIYQSRSNPRVTELFGWLKKEPPRESGA